jgi:uncharacterized protein
MNLGKLDGILDQHTAVLGKTRSGKSSVMRGLVEGLLDRKQPVCIVDPKGDWWGIKLAADGKRPGYPVVIFGGEHADVPINEHAGAHVAELFATGNRPCLIDLGGWMVGPRTRFWVDFASTLFKHTKGRRWLAVDEIHNFAPKGKVFDAEAGKALHWTNRLASEGLGKGVAMLFASQRPQKVHNDTLTSAETLIAMRVLHPADRGAVADWIKGCGDERGDAVLASLAQMARGEGWVWSPEIGFGPQRVKFQMFKTYDSFRPQSVQDAKNLKGWAEVDLEEVRAKLSAVIEKAKADDPRELRKRIAELERAARQPVVAPPPKLPVKVVEVPVLSEAMVKRLEKALSGAQVAAGKIGEATQAVVLEVRKFQTNVPRGTVVGSAPRPATQAPATLPRREAPSRPADGAGEVGNGGLRRILIALAQCPAGLSNRQIGVRAGLSSKSGSFSTYLSTGRRNGWLEGTGTLRITQEGLAAVGAFDPLPQGRELLEHWIRELGNGGASRILRVLDEAQRPLTNQELGEMAGLSHNSGSFSTYLSKLRTLELITGRGTIELAQELR